MPLTSVDFRLDRLVVQEVGGSLRHRPNAYQIGVSFRAEDKKMRQGFIVRKLDSPKEVAKALRQAAEWLEWFGSEEYVEMHPETARELGLVE